MKNKNSFAEKLIGSICEKHNLKPVAEKIIKLSPQQLAMLDFLKDGKSYNEIAETTGLGRGTVKSYILNVYKRLEVHTAKEAVIKAKMLGLMN